MYIALSKFSVENFDMLNYLDKDVQELFREFLCRIAMEGIYIRVTSGYRTTEEQKELYKKGASWVLCPHSYHCSGAGIDIAVLSRIGPITYKAIWTGKKYDTIAKIAMQLGIDWGFQLWGVDKTHFHYSGGMTAEQVKKHGFPQEVIPFVSNKPAELERAIVRMQNQGVIPQDTIII